jgi:uncharacterized membrane protein
MTSDNKLTARRIAVAGVLAAISILLILAPVGGFVPVPTPAGNATTLHIPAIIGGILEGWPVGGLIGLVFGLGSFLRAEIPLFKDPLVAILPRIFIGITPYFAYRGLRKARREWVTGFSILLAALGLVFSYQVAGANMAYGVLIAVLALAAGGALAYAVWRERAEVAAIAVAAAVGTLTNTVGVLTMAVVRGYLSADVALGIGILHGIPEIVVAVIITVAVVVAWKRIETASGKSRL